MALKILDRIRLGIFVLVILLVCIYEYQATKTTTNSTENPSNSIPVSEEHKIPKSSEYFGMASNVNK